MKNNTAFSLIELLGVVAIISILVAMIGISAHVARTRAYRVKAQAEAQQFAKAFKSYWVVRGGWPSNYDSTDGFEGPLKWGELSISSIMGAASSPEEAKTTAFIEIAESDFPDANNADEGFLDPWGKPYILKIDGVQPIISPVSYQVVVQFNNSGKHIYQKH